MSTYLIIATGCTGVMLGFAACAFLFKRMLANTERVCDERIKRCEAEVNMANSASVGLGKKVLQVESRLSKLGKVQDEMKTTDGDVAFLQAKTLIEQGVDNLTVANNCGLSDSEINLMRMLHREQQPSKSSTWS